MTNVLQLVKILYLESSFLPAHAHFPTAGQGERDWAGNFIQSILFYRVFYIYKFTNGYNRSPLGCFFCIFRNFETRKPLRGRAQFLVIAIYTDNEEIEICSPGVFRRHHSLRSYNIFSVFSNQVSQSQKNYNNRGDTVLSNRKLAR